jgi:RimJ/RimL family protein N-acetyltransferase
VPRVNEFGQIVGDDLGDWESPPPPPKVTLEGGTVDLEPLDWAAHGPHLYQRLSKAPDSLWTYMAFGPFTEASEMRSTVDWMVQQEDWLPYAIVVDTEPLGFAAYLRINPGDGVIEIGSIVFSPELQKTTAATEAIYLMVRNVFQLGYRRCEWKCDDLNEPSRRAGSRLGFRYEGTFRQATHYKGRNRDTAWFAITDDEWPRLDAAYRAWLSPENFDEKERQVESLGDIRYD